MKHLGLLFVAALVLLPVPSSAQEAPSIADGSRVRVWTAPTSAPFIGTVIGQQGGSLVLKAEGFDEPVAVERSAISRLDRKVGGRSAGKSILNGALTGVAAALVLGLASGDDDPHTFLAMSGPEKALIYGILTVPSGILIGALVGPSPDKWATVPLPATRSSVQGLPSPSLRISMRF